VPSPPRAPPAPRSSTLLTRVHRSDYPGHVIPDAFTGADTAVLSAWFAGTAAYALACIARGNVAAHQTWMARHVASGVWVSFQRYVGGRGG